VNRRPIVAAGAFCDIDQRRLARIDSIVIIAGMRRRGRVNASVKAVSPERRRRRRAGSDELRRKL
jgi:hypothetical protein